MSDWSVSKILYYGVLTIEIIISGAVMLVFPANIVLDIFWKHYSAKDIEQNYREYQGLPAGDGIMQLTDIEQYNESYLEYSTFQTDSIIPLDLYRLKSSNDRKAMARSGRRLVQTGTRATLVKKFPWERFYYNRYYLVKLPDNHYVVSYLDDAYYLKYLLHGRVKLPIGQMEQIPSNEKTYFTSSLKKYNIEPDTVLVMFSQERYENCEILNFLILFAVWIIIMICFCLLNGAVARVWKSIFGKEKGLR